MVQNRLLVVAVVLAASAFGFFARADVLFEGYSKIYANSVHSGFTVSRYEYDPKKKEFTSTVFTKFNDKSEPVIESWKAVAKDDFTPISYTYLTTVGKMSKTIDAKFSGGKMRAVVQEGEKKSNITRDIPKGAFLSTFLVYVILKSPKGLTADTKYDYQAIAEEDATLTKGMAVVKGQDSVSGIKAYRILNEFKNSKFTSLVTEKGEMLSVKSALPSIAFELVPQSTIATIGMQVPTAILKSLFNEVPLGVSNEISKKYQNNPKAYQSQTTDPLEMPKENKKDSKQEAQTKE